MDFGIVVGLRGVLMSGQAGREVRNASRAIVTELVQTGETDVKRQLYLGHGVLSGNYKDNIHGVVLTSRFGRIHDSGVVYGPFLEGNPQRHIKRRTPGYAMFRNARQHLLTIRDRVAVRHLTRAIGRMQ